MLRRSQLIRLAIKKNRNPFLVSSFARLKSGTTNLEKETSIFLNSQLFQLYIINQLTVGLIRPCSMLRKHPVDPFSTSTIFTVAQSSNYPPSNDKIILIFTYIHNYIQPPPHSFGHIQNVHHDAITGGDRFNSTLINSVWCPYHPSVPSLPLALPKTQQPMTSSAVTVSATKSVKALNFELTSTPAITSISSHPPKTLLSLATDPALLESLSEDDSCLRSP